MSTKAILFWSVMIIVFVGAYQALSGGAHGGEVVQARAGVDTWSLTARYGPIILGGGLILFFVRRAQALHAAAHEGVRLIGQGRYAQALEHFERHRQQHPRQPAAAFNSGVTRLQLWKLRGALADLETSQALGGAKVAQLAPLLSEHLALVFALLGQPSEARRALASLSAGQGDAGRVALAEAILLLREGDLVSSQQRLGRFEVKQLAGTIGALSRTLDALCHERVTGETRHVDRVALFGESGPEELREAWPELIAFVERAPA